MIATWMLYCVAVGVLLSCGALALEQAVRPLGWATRWTWAAALLLTLAVPAATRFLPALRPAPTVARPTTTAAKVTATVTSLPRRARPAWMDAARFDGPLAAAWGASSAAVVLALAGMAAVLERRRRRWARLEVDGVSVLVSGDTGPAVVGLVRSRIVLPRWAVDADPQARRLVLEHEQEHVRAGDPRLLALALAIAVLTPWNPAVWWQLRRLRLAVEVDCDARVLRRRADVRAYGAVLLEVGRRTVHSRLAAAAFAEPVSSLERRIRIMTAPRVRRPVLRAAAFGAVAAALVAAACETPAPTQPGAGTARALYREPGAGFAKTPLTPETAVATYFPQVARDGLPAGEFLLFVISPEGGVLRHERMSGGTDGAMLRAVATGIGMSQVRSVDVMKPRVGQPGPLPAAIVWVQLKGEGEDPAAITLSRHSSSGDGGRSGQQFKVSGVRTAHGFAATATQGPGATGGTTDPAELTAAVERFYTPQLVAAGVHGQARAEYTVGTDGNVRILSVTTDVPALEPVMRSIVESLTLRPTASPVRLVIRFEPDRVPSRSR